MLVGCWKLMLGLALATNHVHQGKAKLLCWGSIFVVALPLLFVVAPLTLLADCSGWAAGLSGLLSDGKEKQKEHTEHQPSTQR